MGDAGDVIADGGKLDSSLDVGSRKGKRKKKREILIIFENQRKGHRHTLGAHIHLHHFLLSTLATRSFHLLLLLLLLLRAPVHLHQRFLCLHRIVRFCQAGERLLLLIRLVLLTARPLMAMAVVVLGMLRMLTLLLRLMVLMVLQRCRARRR